MTNPEIETDDEIRILDLLTVLGEGKWAVFSVTVAATMVGLAISLILTPIFSSTALVMPAQQGGGGAGAAVLAQLAQTTGLGALGGIAGGKSTDQLYVAMMRSQTIQDALIDKHELRKKWETRSIEDARLKLTQNVAVAVEKQSGLIKITAEDPDPVFAATLANSHVEELQKMLDRVATTEARQRRLFYESQIAKTQTNLEQADMRYRLAQASSGIQVTSLLAESALRTSTELRAKITALEIQLQASSQFLTANNPDTQRAASELAALRARLKQLEQGSGQAVNNPTQQATVQAFRELKVQEAKLDAIVRQLELAKIDEAKEGVPVQIVDQAIPAERKSSPKRAIIVMTAAALGLLIGLIVVVLRASVRNFQRDQENQARFRTFVRSWALRS
jgi:uncharacterized protein involved in exopolysaccharide biosynthesis